MTRAKMQDPAKNPYSATTTSTGGGDELAPPGKLIAGASRTGLTITVALVQGLMVMSAIVLFLCWDDLGKDQPLIELGGENMIFLIAGLFMFAMCTVSALVLRKVLRAAAIKKFRSSDESLSQVTKENADRSPAARELVGSVQAFTLISQALLEGQAVINLILFFVQGNVLHLIPVVIGIVGIAVLAPTERRFLQILDEATQNAGRSALVQ